MAFNNTNSLNKIKKGESVCVSWSGGKDCALSLYHATQAGMDIHYLISALDHTGRLGAHALTPYVLNMQAKAIGIPLVTIPVTVQTYDHDFRCQLVSLKQKGITSAVFGDVNLGNGEAKLHRHWIDSICNPVGLNSFLPLWDMSRESILRQLVDLKFDFRFVVLDKAHFTPDWLGKRIDHDIIDELKRRAQNSSDGKVGYYHTFVLDGPIFQKKLDVIKSKQVFRKDEWGENWYWEIEDCQLQNKTIETYLAIDNTRLTACIL